MKFPEFRNRRLRSSAALRSMVAEHHLSTDDFIVPLFVVEGQKIKEEIPSMPNYYRYSLDLLEQEVLRLWNKGLKAVLLFVKVPDELKDNRGTEALNPEGLMQRSIQAIKAVAPEMVVMTDVALDPYSSYGHDGIVENNTIVNDPTIEVLSQMALSHAQAGADVVAPSDMMDGRIRAIRSVLEENQLHHTAILSYTAKYASAFYGPFRDALDSAPGFGDKKTYQMDPANHREALLEAQTDIEEGADILMVKPGAAYLDILSLLRHKTQHPLAVYQVSGSYAMLQAAVAQGWLDYAPVMLEQLLAFKRAGAQMIATYHAENAADILNR